jgi:hypothetical protein
LTPAQLKRAQAAAASMLKLEVVRVPAPLAAIFQQRLYHGTSPKPLTTDEFVLYLVELPIDAALEHALLSEFVVAVNCREPWDGPYFFWVR